MEGCFLSFIVPVYNAAKYLPECLDSLLNQGIPPESYEIICVNDGSKDDSLSVLQRYQGRYPNIVIIDKENGGVTTARNAGLNAARGEYIWFVDSDDFLKENVLPELRQNIIDQPCDRLIIGCYIFDDVLSEEEKELSRKRQLPLNGPGQDSIVVRSLFRRAFLQEHDLWFRYPDITHGEDGLFMYEANLHSPTRVYVDEAIYFYRIHSGSADASVSVGTYRKKLNSYIKITNIVRGYYQSGQTGAGTANTLMTFLWFALLTSASLPPKESRLALKQLKEEGLFPFRRPKECTLTRSYMTDREDIIGKIYDKLYMNLHTRWGYAGIFLIRQLLRLKHSIMK